MNKYAALYADVYAVFATVPWGLENIPTYPENFVGTDVGNEYIRLNVIAGGQTVVNATKSITGQLLIDIFFPAGGGSIRASQIADKLDTYLAGQSFTSSLNGTTQFQTSTLVSVGNDKDNPSLYRFLYTISFNHFGA